ncbi:MAG: FAD-dependent oxidoreductase [Candidatus Sumerlaeaceae bacterium]
MRKKSIIHTDIAIAGGGSGGTAAAIQAARMGASVVLVEETPWLGGMLTSAGVVAFDGNLCTLTCGFYREVVKEIELHYGGPAKTAPGWVTSTAFEPRVLAGIFEKLVRNEQGITVFFECEVTGAIRQDNRVTGFSFRDRNGEEFEVHARTVMDGTEFGELIQQAGIEFRFGREDRATTGEPDAPEKADLEIQDITYVAILKDYQRAYNRMAPPVEKTADYDPSHFSNSTAVDADAPENHDHTLHTWETFIDYGKLPNLKTMINWPFHANDFPDALSCFDRQTRPDAYRRAKAHTLNYIHYIQTVLGHPELGIADDEFPTEDALPFMPYVRETRRIIGDVVMREQDVLPTEGNGVRPPLQKSSIAVGDYFLDHHHARAHPGHPNYFHEKYPLNATFQVPFGVFFPRGIDGFMAIEKSISVTHIVNGCTRLQPIVLLMGQAAGACAAMGLRDNVEPRNVNLRKLQEFLLLRDVMLYAYEDLATYEREFLEAQKLALAGVVLDGETFQYGKSRPVTWDMVAELLVKAAGGKVLPSGTEKGAYRTHLKQLAQGISELDFSAPGSFAGKPTRSELAPVFCRALELQPSDEVTIRFLDMPHTHWSAKWIQPLYERELYDGIWHVNFEPDAEVPRWELALMIDRAFDPFHRLPI